MDEQQTLTAILVVLIVMLLMPVFGYLGDAIRRHWEPPHRTPPHPLLAGKTSDFVKPVPLHAKPGDRIKVGDLTYEIYEEARVQPLICRECNALWLLWPKEFTGRDHDTLNVRSPNHCKACEASAGFDGVLEPPKRVDTKTGVPL